MQQTGTGIAKPLTAPAASSTTGNTNMSTAGSSAVPQSNPTTATSTQEPRRSSRIPRLRYPTLNTTFGNPKSKFFTSSGD